MALIDTSSLFLPVPGLCESQQFPLAAHEWSNALAASAWLLAAVALSKSHVTHSRLRIVGPLLLLSGLSSFYFHWTLFSVAAQLRAASLVLLAYLSAWTMVDATLSAGPCDGQAPLPSSVRHVTQAAVSVVMLGLLALAWASFSTIGLWALAPAVLVLFLIVFVHVCASWHACISIMDSHAHTAIKYETVGLVALIGAGVLVGMSEPACRARRPWALAFVFSYGLFQILAAYGVYTFTQARGLALNACSDHECTRCLSFFCP